MNHRITIPCPRCSGTGLDTHEDRHTGTNRDICGECGGEGTVRARTGETAQASFEAPSDLARPASTEPAGEDLIAYIERQWAWSKETFGPALRTKGIVQHITKELREIEADPHDLSEWVDVIILAMDGFWRHGGAASDLLPRMQAKQDKNFARFWPDWRTMGEDQAIEHDRSGEPTPAPDRQPSSAPSASPLPGQGEV